MHPQKSTLTHTLFPYPMRCRADETDRLQLYNQRLSDMFDGGWSIRHGASFTELLTNGLAVGTYELDPDETERWSRERVERHREPGGPGDRKNTRLNSSH